MTTDISVERDTLQCWLEMGRPVTLLDVRPAAERAEWFIPGSLHVDAYDRLKAADPDALAGVDLPAGAPVVTICAAGRTSLIAAEQLRARGVEALSLAGRGHLRHHNPGAHSAHAAKPRQDYRDERAGCRAPCRPN